MNSRIILCILIYVILGCNRHIGTSKSSDQLWENLFDEDHQKRWKLKIAGVPLDENYLNTCTFSDNMLEISYKNYKNWDDKFGHLFYDEKLSHYIVELEYNIDGPQVHDAQSWGKLNSGIMLHSQSAESMTMQQWFPNSLEMQFLACRDSIKNPTGNLCTPGTVVNVEGVERVDHCMNSTSKLYPAGRWVKARAEVYGDSLIKHIIENEVVFTYTAPKWRYEGTFTTKQEEPITGPLIGLEDWKKLNGQVIKDGHIALQAESQDIKFRNVRLLNLCGCTDPKAKNYKSYFVKSDASKCRY
jgi:hypothetical protein